MLLFPDPPKPKPIQTAIGAIVDPVDRFIGFIKERESVCVRRDAGQPRPWTGDVIFHNNEFCNIDRERDRGTREIASMWRDPHADDRYLIIAMAVARLVNFVPTLKELGWPIPFDAAHFLRVMRDRERRGEKCWGDAYTIHADNRASGKGRSKADYVANDVLAPMWASREQLRPRQGETLAAVHARLIECEGIGGFMSAQILADTKFAPPLNEAPDWESWAASGPGSRRGLNLVLGRDVDQKWQEADWRRELKWLRTEIASDLEDAGIGKLDAQNCQNCLCENSKYERIRMGGRGRPFVPYEPSEPCGGLNGTEPK